jgi:adenylyl-sulfate kinase
MSNQRLRILLACMPKSGSTFLSSLIAALPGFSQVDLVPTYGHREQELCPKALEANEAAVGDGSYVAQHHVRYSAATDMYMKQFGLRPIVLVRNIFDVIPSLIDHHALENHIYPAAWAPCDIATRSYEEQAHFVTQMAIPWYFNFFASWHDYKDKLVVRYEDLVAQPREILKQICEHMNIVVSPTWIDSAVESVNARGRRKNKVTPGRGKHLPKEDIAAIVRMTNHYPDIDFGPIGISYMARQERAPSTPNSATTRVFWITGLPGAGKTTLARAFQNRLNVSGIKSVILDGDELRAGMNADLGFSDTDRNENVRRIAEVASLFQQSGHTVIVSVVSPTREQRERARQIIGERFTEVFVDTPVDVCESRDPKGNYRRAKQGRIANFTGVSAPYARPQDPAIVIDASLTPVETEVDMLMGYMLAPAGHEGDGHQ